MIYKEVDKLINLLPDGFPPLSVYETIKSDITYNKMERFSDEFLRKNANVLKFYSNKWVVDPFHTWSRIWEYIFVYEKLREMAGFHNSENLNILDAGSGLTFFPHFIVNQCPNISIQCCDYDPKLETEAKKLVVQRPDSISYSKQDISKVSYENATFDAIYCISVLEHCDEYDNIIGGFARILKPGGRLILTVDISLDGKSEISREQARHLIENMKKWFDPDNDYESIINTCDESKILTTKYIHTVNPSLLPWKPPSWYQSLRHFITHGRLLKEQFPYLTCFCMSFTLRESANSTTGGLKNELCEK